MNAWLWFVMLLNGMVILTQHKARGNIITLLFFVVEFAGAAAFLFLPLPRD